MNLNQEDEIKLLKDYIKKIEFDNLFLFEQNNKLKNIIKKNNIDESDKGVVDSIEIHKNNYLKTKLSKPKIIPLLELKKEIKKIENKEIIQVITFDRSSESIYNNFF